MNKQLHILSIFIIVLAAIICGFGLFYKTGGLPYDFINQYGDIVKIYGNGIYKNDSYFMAPIFKGTDCTILFVAIPLLLITLILDIKRDTIKTKTNKYRVYFVWHYFNYIVGYWNNASCSINFSNNSWNRYTIACINIKGRDVCVIGGNCNIL
jgi:hypothetical protein